MGRRRDITQERLRSLLTYDPFTGEFRWLAQPGASRRPLVGTVAGSPDNSGHIKIKIDGVAYSASHLAWFFVYGLWPTMLDHEDVTPANNRIWNLRESTRQGNSANRRAYSNSQTGVKGVTYRAERSQPWVAQIRIDGKLKSLGHFSTKEDAAQAYIKAAKTAFGEFARAA